MKYNYKEIGKRIKSERENIRLSQDGLIDALKEHGISVGRNTISAIENGRTNHYDADLLFALCKLFNCELGYLLCEYDCKTGRDTDICRETGLTEGAVSVLRDLYAQNDLTSYSDVLSVLLESESLISTLDLIALSISARNPQYKQRDTMIAKLDWGNIGYTVRGVDLIESLISTRVINMMQEISVDYIRKYNESPMTRRAEAVVSKLSSDPQALDDMSDEEYENMTRGIADDELCDAITKHIADDTSGGLNDD